MYEFRALSIFVLLLLSVQADAVEIENIHIPDTATVNQQLLVLNGAGVRTKFFFDIYIGALYLPSKTTSATDAISSKGNKRVLLRFLYAEVSKERLIQGWIAGFERVSKGRRVFLQTRINQFNRFFQDMKKGDSVIYDFLDNGTTVVTLNAKTVGSIEGVDFQQALLAIWLGDNPADSDLKAMMLGGEK